LRAAAIADQPSGPSVTRCTRGTLQGPQAGELLLGRQADAQAAVLRDRHAARQHLAQGAVAQRRIGCVLLRPDQLHPVTAREQAVHHALQTHRHAIDLGRPGLGHDGNAQCLVRRLQAFDGEGDVGAGIVATHVDSVIAAQCRPVTGW